MKPEPFAPWQCPLCGEPLTGDTALKCGRNHSFDRAKEGYWHLLPVQSMRTKAPGDSKEMVAAHRAFLNAGYYGIFGRALGELCLAYGVPTGADAPLHLLDAGCGLFQYGGLPGGIVDGQAVRPLIFGHLQNGSHPALEQRSQLRIHRVDLGTGLFQCVHGGHILFGRFLRGYLVSIP